MPPGIKQRLRRRLLGNRASQLVEDVNRTAGLLGNRHYLERCPELKAPGFIPPINAYEFGFYSQNGEDGIILHLLDKVGVVAHTVVEIGTEDVRECNSANLIFNFGWNACLIEADEEWVKKGRDYLASMRAGDNVVYMNIRATPEDINGQLEAAGYRGEIDVLSIDIDSHDYWLWESIHVLSPRIVAVEYNASFGPSLSVTVPAPGQYDASKRPDRWYHGASITALQRLGRRKGYELVGGDSRGVNAFFVRRDLMDVPGLTAVAPESAFRPHHRRGRRKTPEEQYEIVTSLPLVTID